tara:strand:+ start:260 stop:517 length:258 start_codon:yes stop_codon:yes gene_type:complete
MTSHSPKEITPADIEEKIKDLKSEVLSISGGISVAQKIAPSAMTMLGILVRGNAKRKRKKQRDPIIQIQLFPNVKKYFRNSTDED